MRDPIEIEGVGKLHFVDDLDGDAFRVLLLDDDTDFLTSTKNYLAMRGIDVVDTATSILEASNKLSKASYDAILADVYLPDPSQKPDDWIQGDQWLLEQSKQLAGTYMVALTGYPGKIRDPQALMRRGIVVMTKSLPEEFALYDDLENRAKKKRSQFENRVVEIVKLIQHVSEADISEVAVEEFVDEIQEDSKDMSITLEDLNQQWIRVQQCTNSHQKGKLFESFTAKLLSTIPGLRIADRNRSLAGEEHDIILENNIPGTFWTSLRSPFFIVECKHQKKKVGAPDVSKLWSKMCKHKNLVRFGLLVSVGGFTKTCATELRRFGSIDASVVLINSDDIEHLLRGHPSSEDWLKNLVLRSLL